MTSDRNELPTHARSAGTLRVAPRAWIGLSVFLVYVAIIVVVQGTSGIPFTDLADSAANMWRSGILSIGLGAAVVVAIGWRLGWLRAAIIESPRSRARWTLIAPLLYLLVAVGNAINAEWSAVSLAFILSALVLALAVGFAEELTCRGLLLVGLRGSMREVAVWIVTCLCFAAMHGINILLGAAVGDTSLQMLLTLLQGSTFYILRRVTGSLVWAMLLHGFWDFSIFVGSGTAVEAAPPLLSFLIWPAALLSVIGAYFVTRDVGRRIQRPAGPVADGG